MKFNKQLIIILVLGALLMSALGAALYFYQMHEKTVKDSNKKVKVYIAKEKIPKNKQIEKSDIKEHFITKQEVLNRPLHLKEILGKFVKTDIYKNEIFIKEKISDKFPEDTHKKFIEFTQNSYNMSFKMFQNPDYTLQKGDFINIVTSSQTVAAKIPKYKSKYVARNIKVLGFIENGQAVAKPINRKKVKKRIKKKEVEVVEDVKAHEVVLDIQDKIILDIAEDFQKHRNIFWMVKTKEKKPLPIVKKVKPIKVAKKKTKKRTYPYTWYVPNTITKATSATIAYADQPTQSPQVKNATLVYDYEKACKESSKLLIGLSRNVYLKNKPTLKTKTVKTIYRNYIMAYQEKVGSWYKLCDNKYVHQNEVKVISKKFALKKINNKKIKNEKK